MLTFFINIIMDVLHIVPGFDNPFNGIAVAAKLIAKEQAADIVEASEIGKIKDLSQYGEVWVHSCWLPMTLKACWRVLKAKRPLVRMMHANLDPVRLKYHGWKKWLVGPLERWILRRCERIVATCDEEMEWIERYLGKKCPQIEVTDVKRFFDFSRVERVEGGEILNRVERVETCRVGGDGNLSRVEGERVKSSEFRVQSWGTENSKLQTSNSKLNLLYLGRRHPLKGVEFLERAVYEISTRSTRSTRLNLELRIVSNAFGEELEKVWEWCDVLVLPTLSENFGLVVAEALERGKRVITTDGAPVWGEGLGVRGQELGVCVGYNGRLLYLKGYRDGVVEKRIELLKNAILVLSRDKMILSSKGV